MKISSIFVLCLLSFQAFSQIEDNMETIMESRPDLDWSDVQENKGLFISKKINLNEITESQLIQLGFLTEKEIQLLLEHRTDYGKFIDILELQQCMDDVDHIAKLNNLVFVPRSFQLSKLYNHHHEIYLTTVREINNETAQSDFKTPPEKSVVRYRYQSQKGHQLGTTFEKDAFEAYFPKGLKGGFDHNSAYAMLQLSNKSRIFLGDFLANFGQGLTVGQGFQTGKSAMVMDISQKPRGISPNRSVDENCFFRGAGISHQIGDFGFSVFGSRMRKDASINNGKINGFTYGGMHRTTSELNYKDAVVANEVGFNATLNRRFYSIGISSIAGRFDKPFGHHEEFYKRFDFQGDTYFRSGISHTLQFQNMRFFGEASFDQNKHIAILQGIQWSLGRGLDIGILHRIYDSGFTTFNSQGFGEKSEPENESGTYLSAQLQLKRFMVSSSSDFFQHKWPNFGDLTGTSGSDYLFQTTYQHSRKTQLYLRYRLKKKDGYQKINGVNQLSSTTTAKWRLNAEHKIGLDWRLRSRLEFSSYQNIQQKSAGSMFYVDMQRANIFRKNDLTWRLILSSCEDFDGRIYVFENDLPLSYSMPYFDKPAMRTYLLIHHQLSNKIDVWAKYAITIGHNNAVQQVGRVYIATDLEQQVKFQIRFRI